jgi:signal peptidase I
MAPTIAPGETVTVDYAAYALAAPKRFDVVAFEPPTFTNQVWLMRVVALPGETVVFTNCVFTVDGTAASLPRHITNVTYVALGQFGVASPFTVPMDGYFVLGDNSANANDSRFWGALPRTNILGKVKNK